METGSPNDPAQGWEMWGMGGGGVFRNPDGQEADGRTVWISARHPFWSLLCSSAFLVRSTQKDDLPSPSGWESGGFPLHTQLPRPLGAP